MKKSPALIILHVKKEDAKAFNEAIKAKGAVFIEKTATKDGGFDITYTVPTACKEAVVALLKKSGFSMTEARKTYPNLFPAKNEAKGDDDEDGNEEEDDDEEDEGDPDFKEDNDGPLGKNFPDNDEPTDGDDPMGLKGAGEGSKDWKSQVFSGESPLPGQTHRSTKSDSIVVKASQTLRIPGTNHIINEGDTIRIYPKKRK
jgi:hypothetical protein